MSLRTRIPLRACFLLFIASAGFGQPAPFKTFMNPVIPGDHPDCTVTKVGSDSYTTGSSFNPTTAISFVILRVYDLLGREVATLVDGERGTGSHTAVWDAASNPSGVYNRMIAGSVTQTRKMVLAR